MNVLIILCYNDDDVSVKYIKQIVNYSTIDKIVVVDNGSKNEKIKKLRNELDKIQSQKITLIQNRENVGYAKGNNIGIRYAINQWNPDCIAISNTDVEYTDDVMAYALEFLDKTPDAGIVSPKMVLPNGEEGLVAWKLPKYWMTLWNACDILKKIYNPQKYKKIVGDTYKVDVLPGSLLIGKAETWKKVDGFDEETFLYGEESLLAYKVLSIGKSNYLLNNVEYLHQHSTIINKNIKSYKKKMKMLCDANLVYNRKCLHTSSVKNELYKAVFSVNVFLMTFIKKIKKEGE